MTTKIEIGRLTDICKSWYSIADARQRANGACWYHNTRAFCIELADTYHLDLAITAGVVAALSPAVYWDLNKRHAKALVQAYATGGWASADQVVLSTYSGQALKAKRILVLPTEIRRGQILGILGRRAFKTRAFFLAILGDDEAVCIDRHIIAALNFTDRWVGGSAWCYDLLADAVRQAAEALGIVPYVLQATIWVTFKEVADAYSLAEQGVQHAVRGRSAADLPV